MSMSVAWVAKEMVASSMSTTPPAESNIMLPDVVVRMVRLPEVASRIPAETNEISAPVPELVMASTAPDVLA